MRTLNFAKRNFKEIIRDPLSIIFASILHLRGGRSMKAEEKAKYVIYSRKSRFTGKGESI